MAFEDVAALLEKRSKRSVYRALVYLGPVQNEFLDRVFLKSELNDRAVSLDTWMFHIEPAIVSDPESATGDRFHLGYFQMSLSGQGYCMPRSQREVMDVVRAQPETQAVEHLCEEIWPATPREATPGVIEMRRAMGSMWPYDELDRPVEWNWVISENY